MGAGALGMGAGIAAAEAGGFTGGTGVGVGCGIGLGVEGVSILRKWFMTEDHAHAKNGREKSASDEE